MEGRGKEEELGNIMLWVYCWINSPGNVYDPRSLPLSSYPFTRVFFAPKSTVCVARCQLGAWRLSRQNTRWWGHSWICGSSRHFSMDFRALAHHLLPISSRAQREGRDCSMWAQRCLLLKSTEGWSGLTGLCGSWDGADLLWAALHWDLVRVPGLHRQDGVTTCPAAPPPLAHPRFTMGSK